MMTLFTVLVIILSTFGFALLFTLFRDQGTRYTIGFYCVTASVIMSVIGIIISVSGILH